MNCQQLHSPLFYPYSNYDPFLCIFSDEPEHLGRICWSIFFWTRCLLWNRDLCLDRGIDPANHRSEGLLEFVGLWSKRNKHANSLTLVERKRLELARSLATNPKFLLLDEVMAGLNPCEPIQLNVPYLSYSTIMRIECRICFASLFLDPNHLLHYNPP